MNKVPKVLFILFVFMLSLGFVTNCSPKKVIVKENATYGALASFNDEDLTLEKMLTYAIQDEYLAKAEYQYILDTFNNLTPFQDVMMAEVQHIADVKILLEKYKFPVPEDLSASHLTKVENSEQTYEIGVKAELDNIAMYEDFLTKELPEDVTTTFEFLIKASQQHLNVFEKLLTR
jgi:hypothetical protein